MSNQQKIKKEIDKIFKANKITNVSSSTTNSNYNSSLPSGFLLTNTPNNPLIQNTYSLSNKVGNDVITTEKKKPVHNKNNSKSIHISNTNQLLIGNNLLLKSFPSDSFPKLSPSQQTSSSQNSKINGSIPNSTTSLSSNSSQKTNQVVYRSQTKKISIKLFNNSLSNSNSSMTSNIGNTIGSTTINTVGNNTNNTNTNSLLNNNVNDTKNNKISLISSNGSNSTPAIIKKGSILEVNQVSQKNEKEVFRKELFKKQSSSPNNQINLQVKEKQSSSNALQNINLASSVAITSSNISTAMINNLLSNVQIKKHKQTNSHTSISINKSNLINQNQISSAKQSITSSKIGSNSNIQFKNNTPSKGIKNQRKKNNHIESSSNEVELYGKVMKTTGLVDSNINNNVCNITSQLNNKIQLKSIKTVDSINPNLIDMATSKQKSKEKEKKEKGKVKRDREMEKKIKEEVVSSSEDMFLNSIRSLGMIINSHFMKEKKGENEEKATKDKEINKKILDSLLEENLKAQLFYTKLNEKEKDNNQKNEKESESNTNNLIRKNSDFNNEKEEISIDLKSFEESNIEKIDLDKINLKKQTFIGSCDIRYKDKIGEDLFKIEEESIFGRSLTRSKISNYQSNQNTIQIGKLNKNNNEKNNKEENKVKAKETFSKIKIESEERIKKYSVLFEFLNNNIKEITDLVNEDTKCVVLNKSNKTRTSIDKESICKKKNLYIETEFNIENNQSKKKFKKKKKKKVHEETILNNINLNHITVNNDISRSFIVSSINNDDFYRNFLEERNFYNSVSSFKTLDFNNRIYNEEITSIPYYVHNQNMNQGQNPSLSLFSSSNNLKKINFLNNNQNCKPKSSISNKNIERYMNINKDPTNNSYKSSKSSKTGRSNLSDKTIKQYDINEEKSHHGNYKEKPENNEKSIEDEDINEEEESDKTIKIKNFNKNIQKNNFQQALIHTKQNENDNLLNNFYSNYNHNPTEKEIEDYCKDILNEISKHSENSKGSNRKVKKASKNKSFRLLNNSKSSKKTIINIQNKNFVNYTTNNMKFNDVSLIGNEKEEVKKDDKNNCLIF